MKIASFAARAKVRLILELNSTFLNDVSEDHSNIELLLRFAKNNKLLFDFQLGNEPNVIGQNYIEAVKLAERYSDLRKLLDKEGFQKSKLIGPGILWNGNVDLSNFSTFIMLVKKNLNVALFNQ